MKNKVDLTLEYLELFFELYYKFIGFYNIKYWNFNKTIYNFKFVKNRYNKLGY